MQGKMLSYELSKCGVYETDAWGTPIYPLRIPGCHHTSGTSIGLASSVIVNAAHFKKKQNRADHAPEYIFLFKGLRYVPIIILSNFQLPVLGSSGSKSSFNVSLMLYYLWYVDDKKKATF